jgi:hypothetical protein
MPSPLTPLTTGPGPLAAVALPAPRGDAVAQPAVAVALGLALTLGQLLVVCLLGGCANPADAYRALYQWDSKWYARLAEEGYPDTPPQTEVEMRKAGFFPGYPLLVRAVARVAGLGAADASLAAAQLACWGFWTYVVLFLRRWGTGGHLGFAAALAILVHPCAFFLVAGYSESLFLMAVLGCLYWSGVRGPTGWCLAALHGVVMTGTRIVGLPLALCPFALAVLALGTARTPRREWLGRLAPAVLLGAVATVGGLLFFGFCQLEYGHWDAYMRSQRLEWAVTPDYLAVFSPEIYRVGVPLFVDGYINPNDLSRLCVPFTVLLAGVLLLIECRAARADAERTWRQRVGFYLAGGLMFYIAVSGLANSHLLSMIRYTFCVHVMLTLAVVHLVTRRPLPAGRPRAAVSWALVLAAAVSILFEIMFVRLFTHGEWVA